MENNDGAQELLEIRNEIAGLLEQAEGVLREVNDQGERQSAEAYWLPHIRCALGDFGFSTYSPTMFSTITALTEDEDGCVECGEPCKEDYEICEDCK